MKSSWPNLRKTLGKRPLGRGPDRSWSHHYTISMINISLFLPMAPWTTGNIFVFGLDDIYVVQIIRINLLCFLFVSILDVYIALDVLDCF